MRLSSLDLLRSRARAAASSGVSAGCRPGGAEELEREEQALLIREHSMSAWYSRPSLLATEEEAALDLRWLPPLRTQLSRRLASANGSTSPGCPCSGKGSGPATPAAADASVATPAAPELGAAVLGSVLGETRKLSLCSSSDDAGPPSLSEAVCGLRTNGVSGSSIFCRVPRSLLCSSMTCSSQCTRPVIFLRVLWREDRDVVHFGLVGASTSSAAAAAVAAPAVTADMAKAAASPRSYRTRLPA
mmetsp:Transcript_71196/g.230466  ORF Transcript_71196/g.230466 Transcript_71196/m.230466 type:complete len:245 (-) Transcript_71196:2-736(-)